MKRYKNLVHALNSHISVSPIGRGTTYQSLILITLFVTTMEISKNEDIDFCFEEEDAHDAEYADPGDNEEDDDDESEDGDSVDHAEDERMEEEKYKYKDLPPPETEGPPVCLDLTVIEPEMVTADIKYHEVCDEYGRRGYSFEGLIYYDSQDDDEDEYDDFDENEEELTAM
ncbi:protein E30 [Elephant endotheliotropic herpesvirus 3B]|nr:protein E30 [Elephant endotheliotropic herpesvirus 3B]